jgi:putative oxidoreductase
MNGMKYILLAGRILYSLLFVMAITSHFSSAAADYAASKNVPFPGVLVPVSGVLAFVGGLCVASGFKARWGALLIIMFLLPVTFMMHDFWNISDQMQSQMQMAMFMKNICALGGAMIICYFGSGPLSLDNLLWKHDTKNSKREIPVR